LLDDDSLWCWGANFEGQLGQADPADSADLVSPTQVGTAAAWSDIDAGQGHTLGLLAGAVVATGRNTQGQLGLGPAAPAQVRAMATIDAGPWLASAAGQAMSCGIRFDHSLWCWGGNNSAELGLGDTSMRDAPVLSDSSRMWRSVDVDTFGGCGVVGMGGLACWGRNMEGQLGVGDLAFRATPTGASSFDDWVEVSVGRFHSCGQRADGSVWCTGRNISGEVGVATTGVRSAWTRVWP
jgi:alpha-tubulin suppressor-like RCC1 family protein